MYFIFGPLQQIFFSWCYVNKADILHLFLISNMEFGALSNIRIIYL